MNALSPSEAIQVSTFLHARLRFEVEDTPSSGAWVRPHALTTDLLDVCKTFPADRNGALRAICDEELRYENAGSRPAIARIRSLEECRVMAARLNDLYGIR